MILTVNGVADVMQKTGDVRQLACALRHSQPFQNAFRNMADQACMALPMFSKTQCAQGIVGCLQKTDDFRVAAHAINSNH
jgi:hypothetical protein